VNHARPLRHPRYGHGFAAKTQPARAGLGHGVGGHDRLGRARPVRFAAIGKGARQRRNDALHRQGLHDHAGGKRQDLRTVAAERGREFDTTAARARQAVLAGAGIRVAGIHQQRAHRLRERQMFPAQDHGRGAKAVLREYAGDARAFGKPHDQQILAPGLAHAGLGGAQRNASYRQQIFRVRRS